MRKRSAFGVLVIVLVALAALGAITEVFWSYNQILETERTMAVGQTYPVADSPYPLQVTVLDFAGTDIFGGEMDGDLTVILPPGSTDPRITRISVPGDDCGFVVDFTTPDIARETWTWNTCVNVKGFEVYPVEIRTK